MSPGSDVVLLLDKVPRKYRDGTLPNGVNIAGINVAYLRERPEYVELVHNRGGRVHVWTVDTKSDLELCISLGVDVVISNRPGEILARLERKQ